MRDDQIYRMNQSQANNAALLYKQVHFLNLRMEAFESVFKASKLTTRLLWLVRPMDLIKALNRVHLAMMKKHDQDVRDASLKAKEEAAKPKLTLLSPVNGIKPVALILCVLGLLSGCVPKVQHKKDVSEAYAQGYEAADKECIELQKKIAAYISSVQKKPKWTGDTDSGEVTGNESWQK